MIRQASGQRGFEIRAPARDGGGSVADSLVVAQVVTVAHERVDRAHGQALIAFKQQKRVIEILGLGPGYALAERIRFRKSHAARLNARRPSAPSSSPTRSTFEIDGRARSTSKSCRSIFSSTFSPPRLNNSRSMDRRRSTCPASGRPFINSSRAT